MSLTLTRAHRARRTHAIVGVAVGLTVLLHLGCPALAFAGRPLEAVQGTVGGVAAILADPQLKRDDASRNERVRTIIHEAFDFAAMARASLGDHWTALNEEQRHEFVGLFRDLFERSYDRLVLRFLGESETTYGAETIEDDRAVVRTVLLRKQGDELPVDYRLVSAGGRWAMSDVVVDGVSLAANFHSQFEKTIRTSSYEALLQKIRDRLAHE